MLKVTHKASDKVEFESWVKMANKGDACLYHEGVLANDRAEGGLKSLRINGLALEATKHANDGIVNLLQKRIKSERYQYIAVRTSKPLLGWSKPPAPQPTPAIAA